MVISTFLSAPIMYVSAWLLTMRCMDPQRLMNSLQNVSFNISIVSFVALVSQTCHFSVVFPDSSIADFLSAESSVFLFVLSEDMETEVMVSDHFAMV